MAEGIESSAPSQGETTDAGLDAAAACKRIDHPATIKGIDDVCAAVEGDRAPESLDGCTIPQQPAKIAQGVPETESGADPSSEAHRARLERIRSAAVQENIHDLAELIFGSDDDTVAQDGTLKMTNDEAKDICAALLGISDSAPRPVDDSPEVYVDPKLDAEMLSIIERAGSDHSDYLDDDDDGPLAQSFTDKHARVICDWLLGRKEMGLAMGFISHDEINRGHRRLILIWIASLVTAFVLGTVASQLFTFGVYSLLRSAGGAI